MQIVGVASGPGNISCEVGNYAHMHAGQVC